jgi:hypothetical protein
MTKKKRQGSGRPAAGNKKQQSSSAASLIIPIVVGVAVVAIIVFAIFSLEDRQPVAAAVDPAKISVPLITAEPLATRTIPFPDVPRISVQDMVEEMEKGNAILVDVRSKAAYDTAHAAGAISIPEEEISSRSQELPRDKDVVFYCT